MHACIGMHVCVCVCVCVCVMVVNTIACDGDDEMMGTISRTTAMMMMMLMRITMKQMMTTEA